MEEKERLANVLVELELVKNKTFGYIVEFIDKNEDVTMNELTEGLYRSQGHLNEYVNRLVEAGFVESEETDGPGLIYNVTKENKKQMLRQAQEKISMLVEAETRLENVLDLEAEDIEEY